jgi:signal transduction histidine kinase
LIGDETSRLANLIGDVLDTSKIEAGTFSYSFTDVDLAELLRDVVAVAELGQDEVRVRAEVGALPHVRGDDRRGARGVAGGRHLRRGGSVFTVALPLGPG